MGAAWKPFTLAWQLFILSICTSLLAFCSATKIHLNAPDLTLRLRDGPTDSVGRLEIEFYEIYSDSQTYQWFGTICNRNFRLEEASVACRQLGYRYAEERASPYFTRESWRRIILQEVNCNGNEERLTDCYYVLNEGLSTCSRSNDVGIACTNEKPPETSPDISPGDLRLVGGPNPYEGLVEVFLAETGEWATLCSTHWDFRKAELACEKLGYRPATSTGTMRYGAGTGPIVNCPATENNLNTMECQIIGGTDPTCNHDMDVDIVCSGSEPGQQGQVRLVSGLIETEGRVEFFDQNVWKRLCSDDWGIEEIQATCRQLGLPQPSSAVPPGGTFISGNVAGDTLENTITCTGQERTLQSCTWTPRTTPCTTSDASARCGVKKEAEEFDLRLDGGRSSLEGRLEIFYQGEWGAVCDHGDSNFRMEEAMVACRQLGYQFAVRKKGFDRSYKDYLLNMVNCNGNEENILDCYHVLNDWACYIEVEVGVVCSNLPVSSRPIQPNPLIGDLRLAGGPDLYEGRVEVYISETIGWATVCRDNVDFSWAEKACQKLEYRPATSVGSARYDMGNGSIARCPAVTDGLDTENCTVISESDPTCSHSTDVDIVCSGNEKGRQGQVRLVNGSIETEGHVEFFDQNVWKTLCSDDWGIKEVQATCRQLGLPQPSSVVPPGGTFSGNEAGDTLENSITCTGQERILQNCTWTPGATPCTTGDASAQCGMRQAAVEFDLRLADGSTITEGRVEMLYQGEWGTICNLNVKHLEATFICNQLGFQYADEGTKFFGRGSGKILVDSLNCNGNEESILECYHRFDNSGCGHHQDLGVICSNLPSEEASLTPGDERLAGGSNPYEGRVEVYFSDVIGWATICQENVDFSWAERACQKLQYRPATSVGTMRYGVGDGPIVICPGGNCQLVNQTDPTTSCNHTRDIDIVCNGIEVGGFGDIRLQNGTEPTEGSVEIFHENVWKRVCADDWGLGEAKTACYQLGMPVPTNTVPGGTFSGNKGREFISEKFKCYPMLQERRLFGCDVRPRTTPCSTGDAGVQCGIWKDAKEKDFRLSGGPNNSSGRVEVFHAGQWGVVCQGYSSYTKDDTVACRHFGFLSYKGYPRDNSYDLPDLPVLLRITECTGKEESVFDCTDGFSNDSSPCYSLSNRPLEVDCDPRPRADSFDVRLVNGPYPNQGIVQVLYNGLKGVICYHGWTEAEAEVICKQLGYTAVVVDLPGYDVKDLYGSIAEDFQIESLYCDGSESNLADCFYTLPSVSWCASDYFDTQAGVVCFSDEYPSVDPRPHPDGSDPDEQPAIKTRSIIIGVSVVVAALLFLICMCYRHDRRKQRSPTPVVADTTQMPDGSHYQYTLDLPPQYEDVTNSPESYPVIAAGPSQKPQENGQGPDESNAVGQSSV